MPSMWRLIVVLVIIGISANVNARDYRVSTYYKTSTCSGAVLTQQTIAYEICMAFGTSGSTMKSLTANEERTVFTVSEQRYADSSCATPQETPMISTESGFTGGRRCIVIGSTSVAISYTATRPVNTAKGVVWSGHPSTASCMSAEGAAYTNFTAVNVCLPYRSASSGTFARYNCDRDSMQKELFSDSACTFSVVNSQTTDVKFSSIRKKHCDVAADMPSSLGVDINGYFRASCDYREDPAELMTPVQTVGAYFARYYHVGGKCKTDPFAYKIEPVVLNVCSPIINPIFESLPYKYSCKEGAGPGSKFTVSKATYGAADLTCSAPNPVRKIQFHDFNCEETSDPGWTGYFVQTDCGSIPASVLGSEQLLLKEYSDADCSVDSATRGVIMKKCVPVHLPEMKGVAPKIEYRKKLVFVPAGQSFPGPTPSPSGPPAIRVQELRYSMEDTMCKGAIIHSSILEYKNNGVCQRDPLSPGSYINRAIMVQKLTASTTPAWFASPINVPTAAPSFAPTASPTFTKSPTGQPSGKPTSYQPVILGSYLAGSAGTLIQSETLLGTVKLEKRYRITFDVSTITFVPGTSLPLLTMEVLLNGATYSIPEVSTYPSRLYAQFIPSIPGPDPYLHQGGTFPHLTTGVLSWGASNDGWDTVVISYDSVAKYVGMKVNGVLTSSAPWNGAPEMAGETASIWFTKFSSSGSAHKMRNLVISTFRTVDWDTSSIIGSGA